MGNVIFFAHRISGCISPDRKFAHRKRIMVEQNIVMNIFFILFFGIKVTTAVVFNNTIFKNE